MAEVSSLSVSLVVVVLSTRYARRAGNRLGSLLTVCGSRVRPARPEPRTWMRLTSYTVRVASGGPGGRRWAAACDGMWRRAAARGGLVSGGGVRRRAAACGGVRPYAHIPRTVTRVTGYLRPEEREDRRDAKGGAET
jgi:hypothetical protein